MVREVMAGAAGYIIFVVASTLLFVLSGFDPHASPSLTFEVVSVIAGIIFALAAGCITAALSPASPARPVIFVALLIEIVAILSLLMTSGGEWSKLAAMFLMAPAVIVGGRLWRQRHAKRATAGVNSGELE
jgi:hypothetical protein